MFKHKALSWLMPTQYCHTARYMYNLTEMNEKYAGAFQFTCLYLELQYLTLPIQNNLYSQCFVRVNKFLRYRKTSVTTSHVIFIFLPMVYRLQSEDLFKFVYLKQTEFASKFQS